MIHGARIPDPSKEQSLVDLDFLGLATASGNLLEKPHFSGSFFSFFKGKPKKNGVPIFTAALRPLRPLGSINITKILAPMVGSA